MFAMKLRDAGLSTVRFVDVRNGSKASTDHTQFDAADGRLSGNYGVYAGLGGDVDDRDDTTCLVNIDIDDYDVDGEDEDINIGLAALSSLPKTFTTKSPHTDGESGGHRFYAIEADRTVDDFDVDAALSDVRSEKTREAAKKSPVALAVSEVFGHPNLTPSWGEFRSTNQYVVAPGSQLDGCSKEWCDECNDPDGGYYMVGTEAPIATISVDDLIEVLAADKKVDRVDREDDAGEDAREDDTATERRPRPSSDLDVDERLSFALETDSKLSRLWNGDCSDYGDRSRAECALAAKLAWWFEGDRAVVESLMGRSDAEKWAERTDDVYRETVLDAVGEVSEFYDGSLPEAGDEDPDGGVYEKMPLWAVRELAVDLDVVPDEETFVTREGDDGGEYLGFPGAVTYNRALNAIEAAGYDHGRESLDVGPDYPVYDDEIPVDGVELHIVPVSGEDVRIKAFQGGAEVYRETRPRGCWESQASRNQIAAPIADAVNGPTDDVKAGVKTILMSLSADIDAGDTDVERMLRTERERGLRDRTRSVSFHPDEGAERWDIEMNPPADNPMGVRTISLDPGEMMSSSPKAFLTKHGARFGDAPAVDGEEWTSLTTYWRDIQTFEGGESDTRVDAIVERFEMTVAKLDVWDDKDSFSWDSRNGFYAEDYDDTGEAAVLLPGIWVGKWMDEQGVTDINLSKELRERGIMLGTTARKRLGPARPNGRRYSRRVWPVSADAVGFDESMIRPPKTDEDTPEIMTDGGVDVVEGEVSGTAVEAGETHVTKLYGAPGSGKTTKLLDFAEREAREFGTSPSDLRFLTFTRSARSEAFERLHDTVYPDVNREDLDDTVRTFHSAALRAALGAGLELRKPNGGGPERGHMIISSGASQFADVFSFFFEKRHRTVGYDKSAGLASAEDEDEVGELPDGNKILSAYGYLKARQLPYTQHREAPVDISLSHREVVEVMESWDEYKQKWALLQHDDYVEWALDREVPPPAPVLIVDEFQDLSPLQVALVEHWIEHDRTERVYVAGDANQAIYGFRGAAPEEFVALDAADVVHRETSYRCREGVIRGAKAVAGDRTGLGENDVANVVAHREGGQVAHVAAETPDALGTLVTDHLDTTRHEDAEDTTVFVLARTNRQAQKLKWGLREAGIPYRDVRGRDPEYYDWTPDMAGATEAIRRLDRGEEIPRSSVMTLLRASRAHPGRVKETRRAENSVEGSQYGLDDRYWFTPADVLDMYPEASTPLSLVGALSLVPWKRDMVEAALSTDVENDPDRVRVGTIHAAKGLEADTVVLSPAYSHKQLRRYLSDGRTEAEERRLFYVGMTRARREVVVAHGFHGGEEFPPLSLDGF